MNKGSSLKRVDKSFIDLLNNVKGSFNTKGINLSDAKASKIIALRMRPMMFDVSYSKGKKRKKSGVITLKYEDFE